MTLPTIVALKPVPVLGQVPEAVLAKIAADRANRPEPINNTELIAGFRAEGGNILHIRPRPGKHGEVTSRGMTIAYMVKSGRIIVSTSVQHRNDPFTKKIGTRTAIEHFRDGKTVVLPLRGKREAAVHALKFAFFYLT